jgi:ATP-dependent Lon protease
MIDKLKNCFDEMVVYKDLKTSNFFSALSLPSFMRACTIRATIKMQLGILDSEYRGKDIPQFTINEANGVETIF